MDLPRRFRSKTSARTNIRLWIGLAIMMAGAWALTSQFWAYAQNHPMVFQALAGARPPRWRPHWAPCP